jgi:dipeptidase E
MTKIYFLGGEDIKKRESKKINARAFDDAGGTPTVLVFPWTAQIEKLEYRKIMIDYFEDIGVRKIEFAEITDSLQKIVEKVDASDLIYLPGGNTELLIKRIKDARVHVLLQKYNKVIIGNSAGSLALCRNYAVIKGQDEHPKTELVRGVGWVDFAIAVHYKSPNKLLSGQEPDKELRALSEKANIKIYAIPERGALVYDGCDFKFIGDIYLFYKGEKTKCR